MNFLEKSQAQFQNPPTLKHNPSGWLGWELFLNVLKLTSDGLSYEIVIFIFKVVSQDFQGASRSGAFFSFLLFFRSDRGFEAGQYHAELQRGRRESKYSRLLWDCHRLGHPLQQDHLLNYHYHWHLRHWLDLADVLFGVRTHWLSRLGGDSAQKIKPFVW